MPLYRRLINHGFVRLTFYEWENDKLISELKFIGEFIWMWKKSFMACGGTMVGVRYESKISCAKQITENSSRKKDQKEVKQYQNSNKS